MNKISAVIITSNAQNTIYETLNSLCDFDEVILYTNNCTDGTISIAKNFNNVKIIDGAFIGFGPTKNKATTYAKNDWILSIDSDEIISNDLLVEIKKLKLNDIKEVFILKRDNYFLNKHIKHSGWGNDYLIRLYNKTYHNFNDNAVHESVDKRDDTITTKLKNSFKHNAVQNINQFLYKVISYSDLASKDKKTCFFLMVLLKAKFAFFKTYFLQLGFLDGWRGFVIAIFSFIGKFFRYLKRYINCVG